MIHNLYQIDSKSDFLLFLSKLLGKVVKTGNVIIYCPELMIESVSNYLWQISNYNQVFPHGISGEIHSELQIIYLTSKEENVNAAQNLIILDYPHVSQEFLQSFAKVLIITNQYNIFQVNEIFKNFNYWKLSDNQWITI